MARQIPQDILHNYRVSVKEGMCAHMAVGLVNPFLGLYAVALGASNLMVGLITSLPSLVTLLMMIPAAYFTDRYLTKLPLVFWSGMALRSVYLPMAFVPFLPALQSEALVLLLAFMTIPGVVFNVSWTNLFGGMFPPQYRGELFGRRNMWLGLVGLGGTILAGQVLDLVPFPYNWTTVFTLAFVAAIASTVLLRTHRETPLESIPQRKPYLQRLREMCADPDTGSSFRSFLIASVTLHFGINFAAPYWAIYFGRDLGLSNTLVGTMATVSGLTTVLFSVFWGKKVNIYGNDLVFIISLVGIAAWPFVFTMSSSPLFMIALHAVIGFFLAAFNLTIFNLLLEAGSTQYRSTAVATFHTLNALTGFVGPFLGTWALLFLSTRHALMLSSVFRTVGLFVFLWDARVRLRDSMRARASLGQ